MTPNERALSDEVDLIIGDMVERFADYLLAGGRPVQDLLSMVAGVAARRE